MENEAEILVEVKGVSKKFSRSLKRGMWLGLKDLMTAMLGMKVKRSVLRDQEFWAVKDINFTLRRGECLGLIGHNGAGKSTLLKMLNGLIRPDEGSITMKGKVGALIELGAGFNPLLSGKENIYLNGQILGFSKKEIDEKMQAILDFAEIGEFINSPIQNYSSGMKVRLGFAVAAQMEPDVLIIDEVLAVGDLGFILKCFNAIDELMQNTAVIFVSHNMPQVSRVCSGIMLMDKGKTSFHGNDVSKGIDLYYAEFGRGKERKEAYVRNDEVELLEIGFENNAEGLKTVNHLEDLKINVKIKIRSQFTTPFLALTVLDIAQRPIGLCLTENPLSEKNIYHTENGFTFYKTQVTVNKINLSKGLYFIAVTVAESFRAKPMLRVQSAAKFQVVSKFDVFPPIEFDCTWS